MTPDRDLICFKCKHWNQFDSGCKAFKNIPMQIIETNKHDKPLPKGYSFYPYGPSAVYSLAKVSK